MADTSTTVTLHERTRYAISKVALPAGAYGETAGLHDFATLVNGELLLDEYPIDQFIPVEGVERRSGVGALCAVGR